MSLKDETLQAMKRLHMKLSDLSSTNHYSHILLEVKKIRIERGNEKMPSLETIQEIISLLHQEQLHSQNDGD
jgi:hypothetical protein